jgi:hypothetical protein
MIDCMATSRFHRFTARYFFLFIDCLTFLSAGCQQATPVSKGHALPVPNIGDPGATDPRVEFLYWQQQCADYVADPAMPLFVDDPQLAEKLLAERWDYSTRPNRWDLPAKAGLRPHCQQMLAAAFWQLAGLDDWYPTVFLHERVSSGGTRRVLMVDFAANVDHEGFCSLHCRAITPATLSQRATIDMYAGNTWVPGWWEWGIRKDELRFAEADPKDASHFVFRYEHHAAPTTGPAAEPPGSPIYEWVHSTDNKTFIVDGWLRDNGKVDFELRGDSH